MRLLGKGVATNCCDSQAPLCQQRFASQSRCEDVAGSQTFQRFQDVVALAGSLTNSPGAPMVSAAHSCTRLSTAADVCQECRWTVGPERRFLHTSCLGPTHLLWINERERHSVTIVCHFLSDNGILEGSWKGEKNPTAHECHILHESVCAE